MSESSVRIATFVGLSGCVLLPEAILGLVLVSGDMGRRDLKSAELLLMLLLLLLSNRGADFEGLLSVDSGFTMMVEMIKGVHGALRNATAVESARPENK